MRYYLIAGEASGDLHGSNLIRSIKAQDPQADIRAWGGDLMAAAGAKVVKHYRDLAFMGFVEVVKNLRTILGNLRWCKTDILAFQPDVLVLIDYPGFNLRIAKWAKALTNQNKADSQARPFPVCYYISPQIWAWHTSRVHGIKATVDRMLVILPFEPDFYRKYDYDVAYVGHPLLDVIHHYQAPANFHAAHQLDRRPIIALLPGSRRQEIAHILPLMLEVIPRFADYQFVLAGAPSIPEAVYEAFLDQLPPEQRPKLVVNQTYALLSHARAALVTSGTATLETALFGVPEVVCYKGGSISFAIARRLVEVPFISLVNLVAGRQLVAELIQKDCTPVRMEAELKLLLAPGREDYWSENYRALREQLGGPGASQRAAAEVIKTCRLYNGDN